MPLYVINQVAMERDRNRPGADHWQITKRAVAVDHDGFQSPKKYNGHTLAISHLVQGHCLHRGFAGSQGPQAARPRDRRPSQREYTLHGTALTARGQKLGQLQTVAAAPATCSTTSFPSNRCGVRGSLASHGRYLQRSCKTSANHGVRHRDCPKCPEYGR